MPELILHPNGRVDYLTDEEYAQLDAERFDTPDSIERAIKEGVDRAERLAVAIRGVHQLPKGTFKVKPNSHNLTSREARRRWELNRMQHGCFRVYDSNGNVSFFPKRLASQRLVESMNGYDVRSPRKGGSYDD